MTEEQKPDSGVVEELNALGQQLGTAIRSLWESEDSRKLREEIGAGFVELGRQVDSAVQTAQESDAAQQFSEQLKETMDRARESDLTAKFEDSLVTGLRELNEGISKLVATMGQSEPTGDEPGATTEAEPEGEAEA